MKPTWTRVLFACVHNVGRSQMAAALFNAAADPGRARSLSAGTDPGVAVNPVVVAAMREIGIDLAEHTPTRLTARLSMDIEYIVTMGCGLVCPLVPAARREDWPVEDPVGLPLERVREIRDELRGRVRELVIRRGWERRAEPRSNS